MNSSNRRRRGQSIADFLAGAWRNRQAMLDTSPAELELIATMLYDSGAAGLAWWRIRDSALKSTSTGDILHQAYRLQALQSAIREERTIAAFRLLRGAGIEPILIKGWAIARFYPHPTLRAYGDIDVFVNPAEYSAARQALDQTEAGSWWVDLHSHLSELGNRPWEELFSRSRIENLRETRVRVLCPEDN